MSLLKAYREAFKTTALVLGILALYGVAGALDDDNQDSSINRMLLALTGSDRSTQ